MSDPIPLPLNPLPLDHRFITIPISAYTPEQRLYYALFGYRELDKNATHIALYLKVDPNIPEEPDPSARIPALKHDYTRP